MKERVINQLLLFSTPDALVEEGEKKASDDIMFVQLAQELLLSHEELQERSQKVLSISCITMQDLLLLLLTVLTSG